MAWVFNPFTGTFDFSGTGGGGSSYRVVVTTVSGGSLTMDSSTTDLATTTTTNVGTLTIANPSGTPSDGQRLMLRLITTAAANTLSFGTQFQGSTDISLPASSSNNKYDYFGFMWVAATSKWQMVSRVQGF